MSISFGATAAAISTPSPHRYSRLTTSLLCLAPGLLSGCVSIPTSTPLERFTPPSTYEGLVVPSSSDSADQPQTPTGDWWLSFQDAQLDALVAQALAQSPTLELATQRFEAALQEARIAGAPLLPAASAGLQGRRSKQNFIGFPIPGSQGQVLSTTSTNIGLSLNVSWEPDLWGRLRAGERAALKTVEAVAADVDGARLSLVGQVARTYMSLIEARAQAQLAADTLASRRRSEERVRQRYERGLVSPLDVRLAATQAESVAATLAARRQTADALARRLAVLLGRYPTSAIEAAAALPPVPEPVDPGLPVEVLARRPDLRALQGRAAAAAERVGAAKAALYPQLTLTGTSGTTSGALGDLLDSNFSVWSLAAGLLQPIFQGGKLRAGVRLAEANWNQTLLGWVDAVLVALGEVETALSAERFLDDQVTALIAAAVEARAAADLAETRYSAGLVDYLGLLESQRAAFDADSRRLTAQLQRLLARVDLILALGGGPPPSAPTVPHTATPLTTIAPRAAGSAANAAQH